MAFFTRALVFDHAGFPSLFNCGAGPRLGRAIFLDQVQPRERNVQLRVIREVQRSSAPVALRRPAARWCADRHSAQCRAPHARHNRRQRDRGNRKQRPRSSICAGRPRMHVGIIAEIVRADHHKLPRRAPVEIQHLHAIRNRRAHNHRRAQIAGQIACLRVHRRRPEPAARASQSGTPRRTPAADPPAAPLRPGSARRSAPALRSRSAASVDRSSPGSSRESASSAASQTRSRWHRCGPHPARPPLPS